MTRLGAEKAFWQHLAAAGLGEDLLPVVCDLDVPISSRSSLTELGKIPSDIDENGYARGLKGWTTKTATSHEIERWSEDDRLGICLQTRICKVFDVDIEDRELADCVEQFLRPRIAVLVGIEADQIPLRFRDNSSKFALIVRCEAVMPKRTIYLGGVNKIEFLGNGQQAVISGTHPSGSRILWEVLPTEAPRLTPEQINKLWRELDEEFAFKLQSSTLGPVYDPDDFMNGRGPKLGYTIEQMRELLNQLDPDLPRELWIRAMCGIHYECEGDDTGFELFDEWSSQGVKYPGTEELRYQWESLRGEVPGRRPVTLATVLKMARDGEYAPLYTSEPPLEPFRPADVSVLPNEGQPQALIPFPGFMADAVDLALSTASKRQPEMTLLGVLVSMAAALGSKSCLPDGMRLNLFGLCVAPTASGKDHILHVSAEIAKASSVRLLNDLASSAGIEDALVEGGMLASIDEIAHILAARADRGGNPHMRDVERMLLKLFSGSRGDYITRVKAGVTPRTVANPALNLLGFAVPTKLGEALTEGDVASGLLNRMLIAVGDGAAPPQLGLRKKFELTDEMLSKLKAVSFSDGPITISPEARDRMDELKLELYRAEQALPEEAPQRLLLGRTLEKALRIAGVLSVFDRPGAPVLEIEHLEWGVNFVRAGDATLVDFLDKHMHGGKVQADAAKVLSIARALLTMQPNCRPSEVAALAAGYVPISLIAKRCHLNNKEMTEAIALLEMRTDMRRVVFQHTPVAGRPSQCASLVFLE